MFGSRSTTGETHEKVTWNSAGFLKCFRLFEWKRRYRSRGVEGTDMTCCNATEVPNK
jgi:hypothetical protein